MRMAVRSKCDVPNFQQVLNAEIFVVKSRQIRNRSMSFLYQFLQYKAGIGVTTGHAPSLFRSEPIVRFVQNW